MSDFDPRNFTADLFAGAPPAPAHPAAMHPEAMTENAVWVLHKPERNPVGGHVYAYTGHASAHVDPRTKVKSFIVMEPAAYLTVHGKKTSGLNKAPEGLAPGHVYTLGSPPNFIVGHDLGTHFAIHHTPAAAHHKYSAQKLGPNWWLMEGKKPIRNFGSGPDARGHAMAMAAGMNHQSTHHASGPGLRERHEDSPFDDRNYHPDMFASGPGDGPGIGMAVAVGLGAAALVGGAMYLLGGKPEMPTLDSAKKGLGFGALQTDAERVQELKDTIDELKSEVREWQAATGLEFDDDDPYYCKLRNNLRNAKRELKGYGA